MTTTSTFMSTLATLVAALLRNGLVLMAAEWSFEMTVARSQNYARTNRRSTNSPARSGQVPIASASRREIKH
jgi:hypothetical protein